MALVALCGAPFGLAAAVPFLLVDLPLVAAARRLEGHATFDDRDLLLGLVGLHAALVALATSCTSTNLPLMLTGGLPLRDTVRPHRVGVSRGHAWPHATDTPWARHRFATSGTHRAEMPLSVTSVRPLVSATPPLPAPLERLGWLLLPGHFLLGLLVLQPYFAPVNVHAQHVFGGAEQCSPVAWVLAAMLTALLATRPLTVGARRVKRGSITRVVVGMVGFGYVNLLLCALLRALAEGEHAGGMLLVAGIFGLPSALLCTVPFVLLDVPFMEAALRLDGAPTFEDEDRLMRLVGLHAALMAALTPLAAFGLGLDVMETVLGVLVTCVVGAGGLALMTRAWIRMCARAAFVQRVRVGAVPRYEVGPLGEAATPARLLRKLGASEALFFLDDTPAAGAYRTGTLRVPIALV